MIYLHDFLFQSAFSQTSSSTASKPRYMPYILMKYLEEICIDIDSVQISGHWDRIVRSISHMQIAIGDI